MATSSAKWLAVCFVAILVQTGCAGDRPAEYAEMERMAEKLRAKAQSYLDKGNYSGQHLAYVSALFAREMLCVAGDKSPESFDMPENRDGGDIAIRELSEWKKNTAAIILNPDADVPSVTAEIYDDILGWALSQEDLSRLREIREKFGYWEQFRARLGPTG